MSGSILVTGGAGFIGSNFIPFFLAKHPDVRIINLDKLTYAANLENLEPVKDHPRYKLVEGDICDARLVNELFDAYKIHAVIHFAAESHVDNSISRPELFIQTNVLGTFNLLKAARDHWMADHFEPFPGLERSRFVHISTDEVYGSLGSTGLFTEETPYRPNSPYSASKASSDHLVRSFAETYGLNVVTTNCSNNYGPYQHDEKFIPTIIRTALNGDPIPIYGDGQYVRDWLYVKDHCMGIDLVLANGDIGETYNIGGKNERTNRYIANMICQIMDELVPRNLGGSYKDQITFVKDRPGHDRRYAIDATKIELELGWKAQESFETGLIKTVKWYLQKYKAVDLVEKREASH
ncbi:MAG: dTDP-glucose 4,6-dehydratase [Bacteroidota bacterium]